jgi:hypothetical protein
LGDLDETIQGKLVAVETNCIEIEDMHITTVKAKMKKQGKRNKKINGDAKANYPAASEGEKL